MMKEPAHDERVLVIKPSSFGDVIHTLPAIAALKQAYPDWRIDWLVNEEWAPLLEGNPDLSEVIPFPRKEFRGLGALWKARCWAKENLAPKKFDRVLDFQGLLRSALLGKECQSRSLIGFARAREMAPFYYDEKIAVPDWDQLHAISRYLSFAQTLGAESADTVLSFNLPAGEAVENFTKQGPLIALHPFSRGMGKSLTEQEVLEFCQAMQKEEAEATVVLLGSEAWSGANLPSNTCDQMGKTSLSQLIWLLRQMDRVVSVDSGPMHLAAALTDRLISIHTWTDPVKVGPWQKGAWIWRDGLLLKVGDLEAGCLPEERKRKRLIEQLRQQTGRLLPEESMARIATAIGPKGVFPLESEQ